MGKRLVLKKRTEKVGPNSSEIIQNMARILTENAASTRAEFVRQLIDIGGKDINTDCGYPDEITIQDYKNMYEREGVATRVVTIWPEESWSVTPEIYDDPDPEKETNFEKAWKELEKKFNLYGLMFRADVMSGIGRFGVILLGLNDGLTLDAEVSTSKKHELLYVRGFDESVVTVSQLVMDPTNPRFGLPMYYNICFSDGVDSFSSKVHWTRIIHLADNREMSDVFGTPRMKRTFNRLLDVRKILGGSGEMFWKGGFPGISFEVDNDQNSVELDRESLRKEMEYYMNGLQRYLALEGVKARSMSPQVADPKNHVEAQLTAIAISEGIPKRILFGSEQGELASSQDAKTWNRRVKGRQNGVVTPWMIRPFIDRLILFGVLPKPQMEDYFVYWTDINTQTEKERAVVAKDWAETLARFVAGDVNQVISIQEFLNIFGGVSMTEIKQILKGVETYLQDLDMESEDTEDVHVIPDMRKDKPTQVDQGILGRGYSGE